MPRAIEHLKPWMDVIKNVPFAAGVYCVWRGREPIYIGTSCVLYYRLASHTKKAQFVEAGADAVTFIVTTPEGDDEGFRGPDIRRAIEKRLMKTHKPLLNRGQLESLGKGNRWKEWEQHLVDGAFRDRWSKIKTDPPQSSSRIK